MPIGRPRLFESAEDMQILIDQYFKDCEDNGDPPNVCGLAIALGTTRVTLLEYQGELENREKKQLSDEERRAFSITIKEAKLVCEQWIVNAMLKNKLNPASGIFNLYNNFKGWKQKQEVEVRASGNLDSTLTEALKRAQAKDVKDEPEKDKPGE